jgi:stage IV sporulation protein B
VILSIDGRAVSTGQDVKNALSRSNGTVSVRFLRKGREQALTLQPEITAEGPKLGVFLRQGVTGIGTVTYYDPETGAFATLGHGVNGSGGSLLKMTDGRAYPARVVSVKKGRSGAPGQLMGTVDSPESNGELTANTARGVFGKSSTGWQGKTLETASAEEVRTGTATILSTVSGDSVQEYSVEILKLYPKARTSGRNMLIRVTDPALLDATGGIVQGMSGSPIIQDGKLVGAVTHVLVNDPTTGYGIFIENMLDAAA